jgi:ribose 1,5-bisphosphokinase PhnN
MSADRIRVLAYDCAGIGQRMAVLLLVAVNPAVDADHRLRCMTDAFFLWPALAVRMAELEALAPRSSAAGYESRETFNERLARFRNRQLSAQSTISTIGE